eukprot:11218782-Lingulodinium_polyedra.AAC.1
MPGCNAQPIDATTHCNTRVQSDTRPPMKYSPHTAVNGGNPMGKRMVATKEREQNAMATNNPQPARAPFTA